MRAHLPDPAPEARAPAGRAFFVTVIDGDRHGILAGPYETFGEAKGAEPTVITMANKADPRAAFYAFGVSQAPASTTPVFGKVLIA